MTKREELIKLTEELFDATLERDEYEIEYELEKARMIFSNEVQGLGNQVQRDAQVTLLLEQNGMYRKMAELRTRARLAWYKWEAIKVLVENK